MSENQETPRTPQGPNQITTQEQAFAEIQRLATERDDTRRQLAEIHTLLARLTTAGGPTTFNNNPVFTAPTPLPTTTTTCWNLRIKTPPMN